jgi:hypothetical protein
VNATEALRPVTATRESRSLSSDHVAKTMLNLREDIGRQLALDDRLAAQGAGSWADLNRFAGDQCPAEYPFLTTGSLYTGQACSPFDLPQCCDSCTLLARAARTRTP